MSDPMYPEDDPMLDDAESREMMRLLAFATTPEIGAEKAAAVWREVQRRSRVSSAAPDLSQVLGRLRDGVMSGMRELAATLVPDALVPSAAVRSAGAGRPRLLMYETEDHTISVSFSGRRGSERLKLIGQVAPKRDLEIAPGGKVAVFGASDAAFGEVNAYGEFVLEDVPPGDLHMDIVMGADAIQISPIQTKAVQVMED